jgi:hypothetical protein
MWRALPPAYRYMIQRIQNASRLFYDCELSSLVFISLLHRLLHSLLRFSQVSPKQQSTGAMSPKQSAKHAMTLSALALYFFTERIQKHQYALHGRPEDLNSLLHYPTSLLDHILSGQSTKTRSRKFPLFQNYRTTFACCPFAP